MASSNSRPPQKLGLFYPYAAHKTCQLGPSYSPLSLIYMIGWCRYKIYAVYSGSSFFFGGVGIHGYYEYAMYTVGPLIIESLWAKKRVSTGALEALDGPLVVQMNI